jgi:hypothetical protein
MTKNEFALLCGEYLIDPAIALENEKIVAALKEKKPAAEIRRLLETEF